MKNLLRFHAGKIPAIRINTFANALYVHTLLPERNTSWWMTFKNAITSSIGIIIPCCTSFLKFWFLIYIQIASNNHNKLMKTLSCTANKSVPRYMTYYSEGWHCIAILMILWNQEATFKRCYIAMCLPVWMVF